MLVLSIASKLALSLNIGALLPNTLCVEIPISWLKAGSWWLFLALDISLDASDTCRFELPLFAISTISILL